jgi:hypothetical protein
MQLPVPFESQLDNDSGQGYRECFSSSCAMLARYWGRIADDDAYNETRRRFGDTTSAEAQLRALRSLGLWANFRTDAGRSLLEHELNARRPVAVGWLHRGPVHRPAGSGHWSVVVGLTANGVLMNDPNGEADLVWGGYLPSTDGRAIPYSWRNWGPRWEVEGPQTGWALTCRPAV